LPAERLIQPNAGNVAFVSQSGGVMVDNMVKFTRQGIGISIAVSIGNKALIREIDMLRYLANDPHTRVIDFYIEGFENNDGRRFVLAAKECPKPIVVMKGGRSQEGINTVFSHTASIAGDYRIFSDVNEDDVMSMINSLKGKDMIAGFGGGESVNIRGLKDLMVRFSSLVIHLEKDIQSIDLNPVICSRDRCIIVDAGIILS
jgi:succinyl-CoA synthetase alpha subunit